MAELKLTQLEQKELNSFIEEYENSNNTKIKETDINLILTPTVKGYLIEVKINNIHKDITDTSYW